MDGVNFIINPYDELSLTRALEITEKHGGTVTVIHVGKADSEANIRKALAIGAHDAVRIDADPVDAYFVARQIAEYAKDKGFDLIFTGRESIDYNSAMVGGLIGHMLGIPAINVITSIEIEGNTAVMLRDIDGGKEKVKAELPVVVSAQKELSIPRLSNMRGIMAARTKPLAVISPVETVATSSVAAYSLPQAKGGVKLIDAAQAETLIDLLHNEAKVI